MGHNRARVFPFFSCLGIFLLTVPLLLLFKFLFVVHNYFIVEELVIHHLILDQYTNKNAHKNIT